MEEGGNPDNKRRNTQNHISWSFRRQSATKAKEYYEIAAYYIGKAAQPIWRFCVRGFQSITRCGGTAVKWIDAHNGVFTAAATLAIAVLTYFLAHYAYQQGITFTRQLNVMQGQLDEMQAARRPWLTVETSIEGPLIFDPAPNVPIKVTLKNVGPSPAMEAWPDIALFPLARNMNEVQEMHSRCAQMRKKMLAGQGQNTQHPGYVLFPDKTYESKGLVATVDQKEWENWLFTEGRIGVVLLDLLVCGDYRFSFAPEIHSTDMIYDIGTPKQSPVNAPTIWWNQTTNVALALQLKQIEKTDLLLVQEPFGDSYAD